MTTSKSKPETNIPASGESINTKTEIDKPIWEIIADIGEQIPDEVWAKAPTDGSINYKHYLYGASKEEE